MTTKSEIITLLESHIEELHNQVELIVSRYWNAVLLMERDRPGAKNRNKLRLRSVKDGNSIRAEWVGISWTGKTKDGKLFEKKDHITKPATSFGYTLTKLYKYAHEWEKLVIEETETSLVRIRQEAHHLTRALISLGHAQKIEDKRKVEAGQ